MFKISLSGKKKRKMFFSSLKIATSTWPKLHLVMIKGNTFRFRWQYVDHASFVVREILIFVHITLGGVITICLHCSGHIPVIATSDSTISRRVDMIAPTRETEVYGTLFTPASQTGLLYERRLPKYLNDVLSSLESLRNYFLRTRSISALWLVRDGKPNLH